MRDYNYKEKWHALLTSEIVKNLLLFMSIKENRDCLLKLIKMNLMNW